jgi:imidazolonepropionase-like amidohydrolase
MIRSQSHFPASRTAWTAALVVLATACASTEVQKASAGKPAPTARAKSAAVESLRVGLDPNSDRDPFPSTYHALPSQPTAIVGGTVLTATGLQIAHGVVVMADGKIAAVGGVDTPIPKGVVVVDAKGKWVTPGVIDAHSHLGVYPHPGVSSRQDGNEMTDPNTAGVWAEHSIWPQDPGFDRARAGGVTTMQILPGSGNLFGGRSVTIKNVPALTAQGMKFPGAPYGLKMACGENPKRVYGSKGRLPSTEMGNVLGYRKAWIDAAEYARKWDDYRAKVAKGEKADPPKRDLTLDTLAGVLAGEILVHNHCYRADEMATMIDISHEFGYHVTMFHHAVEAYKIAPLLAKEGVCVALWAERGGIKMEAMDGIGENAAIVHKAGGCVVIHSDDDELIQRLNQEAGIALGAGARAGIPISDADAIAWITANPAKTLGIDNRTGSLAPGKMADVVIWTDNPFSVYSIAEKVFIDGGLAYDRRDARHQPRSDFELGQPGGGAFHP